MKRKKIILIRIADKRFRRRIASIKRKKRRRRRVEVKISKIDSSLKNDYSLTNTLDKLLPTNTKYLITNPMSPFFLDDITKNIPDNNGRFKVPAIFSLIEAPKVSYKFISEILGCLLIQKFKNINIDYSDCVKLDLGAQVLLDIILIDIIAFYKKCELIRKLQPKVEGIHGNNLNNENVRKLLFSVGSPVIFRNTNIQFHDIIPYKLCVHNRNDKGDKIKIAERKDIDTTKLVDYVLDSLRKLNRKLTPDKIDDLSTVIGEILINAEEHSTLGYRFSIGYFHELNENGLHYGVFRLVILNFGQTIYEKFSDPNCENVTIVDRMKNLSAKYTKRKYFIKSEFEEESLWTLYALQEGVSTIPTKVSRRGNGTIQFIESFFNIKGRSIEGKTQDDISRLVLISGNTNITFDGSYNIVEKNENGEPFKYMTFNKSGNIEEKPDNRFVIFTKNYFPGTIISAKILFNEDDFEV